ncbi:MAG: FkbM family methyltransferase [Betaproteobacteria bacterium]|nr:FkbM family methyltransferase [Betaproteobacteria bacterium]
MSTQRVNRAEGDVDLLVRKRFFADVTQGTAVDVGAAQPDFLSISASFREAGWKVIAIEPNPEFCRLHRERGHEVLQYACGDHDEDDVEFCLVDSHGTAYEQGKVSFESFSSLAIKDEYAKLKDNLDITRIRVRLRRLDTILREDAPDLTRIDLLSIDVEGWELEVLQGLDFARYRPRAMVIENLFNSPGYRSYMRHKGYGLWKYLPPNDVYVPLEDLRPGERVLAALRAMFLQGMYRLGKLRSRPGASR